VRTLLLCSEQNHCTVPQQLKVMTLTKSDLFTVKENYANMIIDGMDIDSLVQYAFDQLIEYFKDFDEDELKEEIVDLYDEETWNDLQPIVEAK